MAAAWADARESSARSSSARKSSARETGAGELGRAELGRAELGRAEFVAASRAGGRAPSMRDCRPWRFRLTHGTMEILADRHRRLPADRSGWAIRIACGAAIVNARLALAVAGIPVAVRLYPDPDQLDLLAALVPLGRRAANPREKALHAAIPHRHNDRPRFDGRPVPPEIRAELRAAAQACGGRLDLLSGDGPRTVIAEIVRAADTALHRDGGYRRELSRWGRAGRPENQDDLSGTGGDEPSGDASDQLIAIVGTAGDSPRDQLVAGMAMQQVLLTATDAGLATSLQSQPIEVAAAREQLRLGLGRDRMPQMLLWLGYPGR